MGDGKAKKSPRQKTGAFKRIAETIRNPHLTTSPLRSEQPCCDRYPWPYREQHQHT